MAVDIYLDAFKHNRQRLILEADESIRKAFDRIVKHHGPKCKNVTNCFECAMVWKETVSHCVQRPDGGDTAINEIRLAAFVERWVDGELNDAATKLAAKCSDLEEVRVAPGSDGTWFSVVGKRGSETVRIEQTQILNTSSKGKLFNQWPARIYVNGKAVSEAAYKKGAIKA